MTIAAAVVLFSAAACFAGQRPSWRRRVCWMGHGGQCGYMYRRRLRPAAVQSVVVQQVMAD